MDIKYIIVQAGGRGSRLGYLTENKPKCLVTVGNRPMLFHLFEKYPDKKFIIIGDYKYDVLEKYLETFAEADFQLVNASGHKGTCSGLAEAAGLMPGNTPFMLIWSDLVLADRYAFPEDNGNYVGLSGDFACRWKYENGVFEEEVSKEYGVSGHFLFMDKAVLNGVPEDGEFVKWLQGRDIPFKTQVIVSTKEYGLLEEYQKTAHPKCRPFNRMWEQDGKLYKEGINAQGRGLAVKEREWYQEAVCLGYTNIPEIYSFEPLAMEKINGKNIYSCKGLPLTEKEEIVRKIADSLKKLHSLGEKEADTASTMETYRDKTLERITKIKGVVPFTSQEYININGKKCHNAYCFMEGLARKAGSIKAKKFCFIHGDCTFSNMMSREDGEIVLVDPRGYFGHTQFYGDPAYDWAKVYYSIAGDYDQFNMGNFRLHFDKDSVQVDIETNGFRETEKLFLGLVKEDADEKEIKLLHALIWLSLAAYAWDDYDSVCAAYYMGLYYFEEAGGWET